MAEPVPSGTARRVAAYRLGFERLAAPTADGDPEADERLAVDVAAAVSVDRAGRMGRYLHARTRFFDRVTVNALGRQVPQVVLVGAGYDGRALRYRTRGVRWWEIDRPTTQLDKRARLARLGVTADDVTFLGLDLADGRVAAALLDSGFQADAPALFLAEGLAVYLDDATLRSLVRDLRSLATPGTRLALSVRAGGAVDAERARFETGVASLGEPAIGSVTAEDADTLLADGRWRRVELRERAAAAGFLVAAPVFAPAGPDQAPSVGRIARFLERTLYRPDGELLAPHLQDTYGVPVTGLKELSVGVHRVERADGSTWIARVFPAARSLDAVRHDAAVLDWLAGAGIPAERTAAADPVSVHQRHAVLVTEFTPGRHPDASPASFAELGALLARIHTLPTDRPAAERPGGSWHHLIFDATPTDELAAAKRLLQNAHPRVPRGHAGSYERLWHAVEGITLPTGLPTAFVHPDFVPGNLVRGRNGDLTVVDWCGAGRGPRVASLGCLLWSAGGHGASVDAAARGYRTLVRLETLELDHLQSALALRPALLACWTFATGRSSVEEAAAWWADQERSVGKAADRARTRLG